MTSQTVLLVLTRRYVVTINERQLDGRAAAGGMGYRARISRASSARTCISLKGHPRTRALICATHEIN